MNIKSKLLSCQPNIYIYISSDPPMAKCHQMDYGELPQHIAHFIKSVPSLLEPFALNLIRKYFSNESCQKCSPENILSRLSYRPGISIGRLPLSRLCRTHSVVARIWTSLVHRLVPIRVFTYGFCHSLNRIHIAYECVSELRPAIQFSFRLTKWFFTFQISRISSILLFV